MVVDPPTWNIKVRAWGGISKIRALKFLNALKILYYIYIKQTFKLAIFGPLTGQKTVNFSPQNLTQQIPGFSRIFQDIPALSRIFQDKPRIFQNIPEYSRIFQDIPGLPYLEYPGFILEYPGFILEYPGFILEYPGFILEYSGIFWNTLNFLG